MLADEPGSGRVDDARALGCRGAVRRDDIALVLVACLETDGTIRVAFDLLAELEPAEPSGTRGK